MKTVIGLALGLALAGTAAGRDVPVDNVGMYESLPGQSLDEFLLTMGGEAAMIGNDLNAEVCGRITVRDEVYYLNLYTNYSQLFCRVAATRSDKQDTGLSIHTHPERKGERVYLTAASRTTAWVVGAQHRNDVRVGTGFSDGDYADGPGYVIESCKLMFQSGRGTERDVGVVC